MGFFLSSFSNFEGFFFRLPTNRNGHEKKNNFWRPVNTIVQSYNNFKNLMQKPSAKEIKNTREVPGFGLVWCWCHESRKSAKKVRKKGKNLAQELLRRSNLHKILSSQIKMHVILQTSEKLESYGTAES